MSCEKPFLSLRLSNALTVSRTKNCVLIRPFLAVGSRIPTQAEGCAQRHQGSPSATASWVVTLLGGLPSALFLLGFMWHEMACLWEIACCQRRCFLYKPVSAVWLWKQELSFDANMSNPTLKDWGCIAFRFCSRGSIMFGQVPHRCSRGSLFHHEDWPSFRTKRSSTFNHDEEAAQQVSTVRVEPKGSVTTSSTSVHLSAPPGMDQSQRLERWPAWCTNIFWRLVCAIWGHVNQPWRS